YLGKSPQANSRQSTSLIYGSGQQAGPNPQKAQSDGANTTDQSGAQLDGPGVNKESAGGGRIDANSPARRNQPAEEPITEPDLYRAWYEMRETDPDAALDLAQHYLQTFPDSANKQRAQAIRNYVNEAYRRPRVTANLRHYVEHGGSPTDREVSDLIADSQGFTPEEADAYRRETGRDFYTSAVPGSQAPRTAQDEVLVNRGLVERAGTHAGWMVSIPELQPGAIQFLR